MKSLHNRRPPWPSLDFMGIIGGEGVPLKWFCHRRVIGNGSYGGGEERQEINTHNYLKGLKS